MPHNQEYLNSLTEEEKKRYFDIAMKVAQKKKTQPKKDLRKGWSERYYPGLNAMQHKANNDWFIQQGKFVSDTGYICVPNIGKVFYKTGEEIKK